LNIKQKNLFQLLKAIKVSREEAVKVCNQNILDDDIKTANNLKMVNLDPIMDMCVKDYMVFLSPNSNLV
jgi:hypothetical protein